MTQAAALAAYGSNSPSNRNRIINGDMRIDQRNAGASVTPTANPTYLVDRWFFGLQQASKMSFQQSSTAPAGFNNSLLATSLSAYTPLSSDYHYLGQRVEGYNVADLGWGTADAKTITLSFWVRSSVTGTLSGSLSNSGATRSYPFTYTISSANTWEQKYVTIAGDTAGTWDKTNGRGIVISFSLGSGSTYLGTADAWAGAYYTGATGSIQPIATSGATFYITGVQLEEGSVATPFEHRQYGQELALCQRYCQNFRAADWNDSYRRYATVLLHSSTAYNGVLPLLTKMRASPTLVASGSFNLWNGSFLGSVSQPTIASASSDVVDLSGGNGSGPNGGIFHLLSANNNDSYMLFTAEL